MMKARTKSPKMNAFEDFFNGIRRASIGNSFHRLLYCAYLALMTGCTSFVKVEPNPQKPRTGYGYVDFYSRSFTNTWMWQVYEIHEHKDIWGNPFKTESRVDQHAWIAEIAMGPHRLVRVQSNPGAHEFRIMGVPPIRFGETIADGPGSSLSVNVIPGKVIPVLVHFSTPGTLGYMIVSDIPTYGKFVNAPGSGLGKPVELHVNEKMKLLSISLSVEPTLAYQKKEEMPYWRGHLKP